MIEYNILFVHVEKKIFPQLSSKILNSIKQATIV